MKQIKTMIAMTALTVILAGCGKLPGLTGNSRVSDTSVGNSSIYGGGSASTQYLVENVGDRVFFQTDQASIDGGSRNTLRAQAEWLAQNASVTLTIEGHADERGTRDYNIALGARRANAVRDFLISQGVDGARLQTISYGKERPVSVCSEEACWSKNRRAVATPR